MVNYCEWCGSELLEDGHCPMEDCPQNVIIDALLAAEEEDRDAHDDAEA